MWLKQSTTITISLGPFVDATDGVTEESGLAGTMTVNLSKNGGALGARNSATAISYDAGGNYLVELNGTDTGTLGRLRVQVNAAATHLPVWQDFMVVPANVWDSMFGADLLQVDVTQAGGSTVAAGAIPNAAAGANGGLPTVDGSNYVAGVQGDTKQTGDAYARVGAPAGASVSADIAAIKAETADILTDTGTTIPGTLTTIAGYIDTEVAAIKAKTDNLPAAPAATGDIPTATENADALLKRDMSAVTGEAARSPLNALRFLRNKWSISGTTLTVTKEDDSSSAWTATVTTDASASPVTGNDPA